MLTRLYTICICNQMDEIACVISTTREGKETGGVKIRRKKLFIKITRKTHRNYSITAAKPWASLHSYQGPAYDYLLPLLPKCVFHILYN